MKTGPKSPTIPTKETLKKQYENFGSISIVATIHNTSSNVVREWLRKYNIPTKRVGTAWRKERI